MLDPKEAMTLVGLTLQKRLAPLIQAEEAARLHVQELTQREQQLKAGRFAHGPLQAVTAHTNPARLAAGRTLVEAHDAVLAKLDEELANARQVEATARKELAELIERIVTRRDQVRVLDGKIQKLQAERARLNAELVE